MSNASCRDTDGPAAELSSTPSSRLVDRKVFAKVCSFKPAAKPWSWRGGGPQDSVTLSIPQGFGLSPEIPPGPTQKTKRQRTRVSAWAIFLVLRCCQRSRSVRVESSLDLTIRAPGSAMDSAEAGGSKKTRVSGPAEPVPSRCSQRGARDFSVAHPTRLSRALMSLRQRCNVFNNRPGFLLNDETTGGTRAKRALRARCSAAVRGSVAELKRGPLCPCGVRRGSTPGASHVRVNATFVRRSTLLEHNPSTSAQTLVHNASRLF